MLLNLPLSLQGHPGQLVALVAIQAACQQRSKREATEGAKAGGK